MAYERQGVAAGFERHRRLAPCRCAQSRLLLILSVQLPSSATGKAGFTRCDSCRVYSGAASSAGTEGENFSGGQGVRRTLTAKRLNTTAQGRAAATWDACQERFLHPARVPTPNTGTTPSGLAIDGGDHPGCAARPGLWRCNAFGVAEPPSAASNAAAFWKTLPIKLIYESLTIRRPISSLPIAMSRVFALCAATKLDASGQGGP